MYNLAVLTKKIDPAQSRAWMRKAAETGFPEAVRSYAATSAKDKDPDVIQWVEKAAMDGSRWAKWQLKLLKRLS